MSLLCICEKGNLTFHQSTAVFIKVNWQKFSNIKFMVYLNISSHSHDGFYSVLIKPGFCRGALASFGHAFAM